MAETALEPRVGYAGYFRATASSTVIMVLRHRRVILAGVLGLTPVLIPLAMAYLSLSPTAQEGGRVFARIMEFLYIRAVVPLMALFFGCMLIGEDVESQVMPYILTRPMPRSSWVLGKFAGYLAVCFLLLVPGTILTYFGCIALGQMSVSWATAQLLLHYNGVIFMGLIGYGSVCLFLGAMGKWPVVIGIVLFFGWQRVAMYVPGLIDFLTIEKYLNAMLPRLATEREKMVIRTALAEFQKREFLIGASRAVVALLLISAAFVIATVIVLRVREYSTSRALGGR